MRVVRVAVVAAVLGLLGLLVWDVAHGRGPGVGIHGTDAPASIGYSASHGCVRMQVPDAEWLFDHVDIGTTVHIV